MSTARNPRRLVAYALERVRGNVDDYVLRALSDLRPYAQDLMVLAPSGMSDDARQSILRVADAVVDTDRDQFEPMVYQEFLESRGDLDDFDEIVLTGDAWFGMLRDLGPVLERMSASGADALTMVGAVHAPPPGFPGHGFPAPLVPFTWTTVTPSLVRSSSWNEFWAHEVPGGEREREWRLLPHLAQAGFATESTFDPDGYPTGEPAVFSARRLIADGCPLVSRLPFRLFPPFLDQHGVIGKQILDDIVQTGFPLDHILQSLARTVPPRALNTNAGLLDVLPVGSPVVDEVAASSPKILVAVHVSDFDGVDHVLDHVSRIPVPYDLVLTTTDGMRAARLQHILDTRGDARAQAVEIRVTPDDPGRDMSDLFVGCRDLLLEDRYELLVKVHSRVARDKTVNRLRYFRRYQLENLLADEGHIAHIIAQFQAEPRLGMVFPPMMHIGYSIAGHGWAGLERVAARIRDELGLGVPPDLMSPLAPFGGMWIARPAAMRRMSQRLWRYSDYRGRRRARELAHVQERLLVEAAAEDGFHVRTVLTPEHAAISHTAIEFKLEEMGRAVRGYPLDQIRFLHAAGFVGNGGPATLLRMYLRLNHPAAARAFLPVYRLALAGRRCVRFLREGVDRAAGVVRPKRGASS